MAVTTGTTKARHIGAELRKARTRTGLSIRRLASQLGMDHTLLSRYESGQRHPPGSDVATILTALGVNGDDRQALVDLADEKTDSHWLGIGMPAQKQQLQALLEFERTATHIVDVSPLLIPGLLQTGDYVRAVMRTGPVPTDEIETRVAVRLGRQRTLTRHEPAHLDAYIGEAALYQTIGGATGMAQQLETLLTVAEQPNVDVRVIPLDCTWNPALEGPFLYLAFPTATPVVHLENRQSALFLHEQSDIEAYRDAADRVHAAALNTTQSAELITRIARTGSGAHQ